MASSSKRKITSCACQEQPAGLPIPRRLNFTRTDYLRALYQWFNAFRRTFRVPPGLYHTGCCYDIQAPLLVTANYHLTVFLLWRTLRRRSVRLLVIDTAGINVWCSSGKGKFSAKEILRQINRYPRKMLSKADKIELVLPKLSLSGVRLKELRQAGITPRIGPVYRQHLPAYLDRTPLEDLKKARYLFSLRDRLFTLLPSLVQTGKHVLYITAGLFIWHYFFPTGIHWQTMALSGMVVVLYVICFPWLPGRGFALKGISLFVLLALYLTLDRYQWRLFSQDQLGFTFHLFFIAAACLLFALSYTGNSGVSNYSLVKKEITRYLLPAALLLLGALATVIIKGVR